MNEDPADFETIYRCHAESILRFLLRIFPHEEAQDLRQIIFVKVNEGLKGFRGDANIYPWIYKVAMNVVSDFFRADKTRKSLRARLKEKAGLFAGMGEERAYVNPEGLVILHEMRLCIREHVASLPNNYRSVLILSQFGELTNPEISASLGISLETVKVRLHRAREAMRRRLVSGCFFYRDGDNRFVCDRRECRRPK